MLGLYVIHNVHCHFIFTVSYFSNLMYVDRHNPVNLDVASNRKKWGSKEGNWEEFFSGCELLFQPPPSPEMLKIECVLRTLNASKCVCGRGSARTPLKELTVLPHRAVFKGRELTGLNSLPKNVGNLLPQDAF